MEASLVGTIATQPLWVIKTRMLLNVVPGVTEMQNLKHSCKQIYKQDGAVGYCRGLGLSLVLSVSGIVQMYSYEALKRLWVKLQLPESNLQEKNFVCGALCKLIVVLSNYPITTVRTRVQQNQFVRDERTMKYHGAWEVVVRTWRDEGVSGFYKGFGANLLKGVLQKGVYFYAYEWLRRVA
jgi:solute carrier family 25 folate transporter 32